MNVIVVYLKNQYASPPSNCIIKYQHLVRHPRVGRSLDLGLQVLLFSQLCLPAAEGKTRKRLNFPLITATVGRSGGIVIERGGAVLGLGRAVGCRRRP